MRISLIVLFLAVVIMQSTAAVSLAQTITLNKSNAPLYGIIDEIREQSGYDFLMDRELIKKAKPVNIHVKNATIQEALDLCFAGQPFTYKVLDGNTVIVKEREKAVVEKSTEFLTPPININGRLEDKNGKPLVGVSVRVKGLNISTSTNADGVFILNQVPNDAFIVFSYVGFESKELSATENMGTIGLVMKNLELDDVEVVNTGYQQIRRENTTGAYATIGSEEIARMNNRSLDRILEGSIPGLSVYKSPDGKNDLRIRGGSSLRAGTEPLFVIDGFISTILPDVNEIENITVLKDAAAAAVWGSQAANGVVVITTKKGKAGHLQVQYSGNARISAKPDYNQLRRADAETLIDYQKEQYDKFYIMAPIFDGSRSGYSQSIGIFNDFDRGDISLEERDRQLGMLAGLSNKNQIDDMLLRQSLSQSHFLSFSGGSDKMQYFLSGNYQSNLAGTKGTKTDAFTLNSRNTYKLASFVDLRTDISALFSSGKNGYSNMTGNIRNLLPYQMLVDENGSYVNDYKDFNKIENDRLMGEGYFDNGFNLLEENRRANNKQSSWGIKTRLGADWKIMEGLSLSNDFIYERTSADDRNLYNQDSYNVRTLVNRLTTTDVSGGLVFNIPKGDLLDINNSMYNNYALRNQLNYQNTFNEKHYLNIIAGFDLRKTVVESKNNRKLGYNDDLLSFQDIDAKQLSSDGIVWWDGSRQRYYSSSYDSFNFLDTREYSYYSALAYTYDKRFTFSGSYRTDHSNLFGADPEFRKTPLWSIGGNWNISKEEFFNSDLISNLGIRATYGLTGNFDRNNLSTTFLVATRWFNTIANDYVARLQTPPNPKLRWERSKTFNLGTDIALLGNRFTLSADYYHKNSYDLLGSQDLDPTVGLTSASINAASMVNKGAELSLKTDIIANATFNWTSSINLAYNKNKVTSNKITDSNPTLNRPRGVVPFIEGYERESMWSYKWAGLDHEGRPQVYDENGDKLYVANLGSLEYSGTTRPKFSGGWSNAFTYRGFDASAFLVFNYGHVTRREMPDMYGYDWSGAYNEQIGQRWRKPGDEEFTDIPAIPDMQYLSDDYTRAGTLSSNSIINASFIRLREIQLGYTLNNDLLKRTPFKAIRIVAQMNNLYIYKYNKFDIDPEAISNGVFILPEPIVTTFGLNISL